MDSLRSLLAAKKAEKQQLVGDKKFFTKGELEEARLKRLREEEAAERRAKEQKRRKVTGDAPLEEPPTTPTDAAAGGGGGGGAAAAATTPTGAGGDGAPAPAAAASPSPLKAVPVLPRDEVIRRLRALGQPATLFGEEDGERQARLARVEKSVALVDEARGGQQENVLLMLKRQEKAKAKGGGGADKAAAAAAAAGKAAGKAAAAAAASDAAAAGPAKAATAGDAGDGAGAGGGAPAAADAATAAAAAAAISPASTEDALLANFQAAAARVAAQRADDALPVEDRMARMLREWCAEWEADLEARSEEVKQSGAGHQATLVFRQSMTYFEPLYERLKRRQLGNELKVGLWMLVGHMRDRNYLAANDVYLKLAIGNAPWPIGVTQVGLHERSAREKISHSMNATSEAHIMNDEATRKYFQAIKRLMTNLQRLRPTDPSRCVDFDVHGDAGRGAAGGGSNRGALLESQARGEVPLALPAAPHHVASDGSVKIPAKWEHILKHKAAGMGITDMKRGGHHSDEE